MKTNCEFCMNYYYDDEYECYCCAINLDEDEMYRFTMGNNDNCHYFRMGDDYTIVGSKTDGQNNTSLQTVMHLCVGGMCIKSGT